MDLAPGGLPSFSRQLRVLGYREALDLYSPHSLKQLVVWLEQHCFEYLSAEERRPLEEAVGEPWLRGPFYQYLETIGSPFAYGADMGDEERAGVVEWMLGYALSLRYAAQKDQYSQVEEREKQSLLLESLRSQPVDSALMLAEARGLASRLGLPEPRSDEARALLLACVRHCLRLLGRANAEDGKPIQWELPVREDIRPLLRLLYCEDAAQLQARVTSIIVLLQNETADPQVDAARGKKGR